MSVEQTLTHAGLAAIECWPPIGHQPGSSFKCNLWCRISCIRTTVIQGISEEMKQANRSAVWVFY